MSEYRDRMISEHTELVLRLRKLGEFLWTDACNRLPAKDIELLIEQQAHMKAYHGVLSERIARI